MPSIMYFFPMLLLVLGRAATIKQKTGLSTKLLNRLFDNAKGNQLGVDASLLEIAFAKHKAPLTHEQAKHLLNSMVKRVDPKGMRWHVENELLPLAVETSKELQAEIDEAIETLKNCSSMVWNAENAQSHRQQILEKDELEEYDCLMKENAAVHEEQEACAHVEKLVSTAAEKEPVKMKEKRDNSPSKVLAALKETMDFYTESFDKTSKASSACGLAREKADKMHEECKVSAEVVEKFYCYMKQGRDTACADYDKCFNDALQNFKEVKSHVEKTEAINKEHFTQMACSAWVKDTVESQCQSNIADTARLDIRYPEEPMQATCAPIGKFHARRDHDQFRCQDGVPVKDEAPAPEALAPSETSDQETSAPEARGDKTNETSGLEGDSEEDDGEEGDEEEGEQVEDGGDEEEGEDDGAEADETNETVPLPAETNETA